MFPQVPCFLRQWLWATVWSSQCLWNGELVFVTSSVRFHFFTLLSVWDSSVILLFKWVNVLLSHVLLLFRCLLMFYVVIFHIKCFKILCGVLIFKLCKHLISFCGVVILLGPTVKSLVVHFTSYIMYNNQINCLLFPIYTSSPMWPCWEVS